MSLKVLYIGGTGQISFDCVHQSVAVGYDTYVFNRGNTNAGLPPEATLLRGDVDDPVTYNALADHEFDVVCQFRAFAPRDVERDITLFSGNVSQYVFISSASAYEKPPQVNKVTEDTPLVTPFWEYSRLKVECETLLTSQSTLPFTVVRPSHTFRTRLPSALGESHIAARRMLQKKPLVVPGDGSSFWTITRAEDFAVPFARLLGNDRAIGEAFHITADRGFTWDQIYGGIGAALGVVPTIVHVASDTLIRYRSDWRGPLLGDKCNCMLFDNSKVKSVAGEFECSTDLATLFDTPLKGLDPKVELPGEPEFFALCDRIVADQLRLGDN